LAARSLPNAASQPAPAPLQGFTTDARSFSVQLVDDFGGSVTASGLQPANAPGHVDPSEQTWFRQVVSLVEQLSQSDPNCPHAELSAPPRHCPVAVQHPAQLVAPHDVPA